MILTVTVRDEDSKTYAAGLLFNEDMEDGPRHEFGIEMKDIKIGGQPAGGAFKEVCCLMALIEILPQPPDKVIVCDTDPETIFLLAEFIDIPVRRGTEDDTL